MPWGVPDQLSQNFVAHLNTRHKFEYDTYVVRKVEIINFHERQYRGLREKVCILYETTVCREATVM